MLNVMLQEIPRIVSSMRASKDEISSLYERLQEITRNFISTFCLGLDINNKSVNKLLKRMSKFSFFGRDFPICCFQSP